MSVNRDEKEKDTLNVGFTVDESKKVKGVAILLMIFHHMYGSVEDFTSNGIQLYFINEQSLSLLASCFRICVYIFVILSSYGLAFQYQKVFEKKGKSLFFIVRRWLKLLSPYWFTLLSIWIVSFVCFGESPKELYGDQYIQCMLEDFFSISDMLGHSNRMLFTVFWYMNFAVLQIILFPVFYIVCEKWGGIVFFLTMLLYNLLPTIVLSPYGGDYNWYLFATEVGILLHKYELMKKLQAWTKKTPIVFRIIIFIILLISVLFFPYIALTLLTTNIFGIYLLCQTLGALACILAVYLIDLWSPIKYLLMFLGTYSGEMYLIHIFVMMKFGGIIYFSDCLPIQFLLCIVITLVLANGLSFIRKCINYNQIFSIICKHLEG